MARMLDPDTTFFVYGKERFPCQNRSASCFSQFRAILLERFGISVAQEEAAKVFVIKETLGGTVIEYVPGSKKKEKLKSVLPGGTFKFKAVEGVCPAKKSCMKAFATELAKIGIKVGPNQYRTAFAVGPDNTLTYIEKKLPIAFFHQGETGKCDTIAECYGKFADVLAAKFRIHVRPEDYASAFVVTHTPKGVLVQYSGGAGGGAGGGLAVLGKPKEPPLNKEKWLAEARAVTEARAVATSPPPSHISPAVAYAQAEEEKHAEWELNREEDLEETREEDEREKEEEVARESKRDIRWMERSLREMFPDFDSFSDEDKIKAELIFVERYKGENEAFKKAIEQRQPPEQPQPPPFPPPPPFSPPVPEPFAQTPHFLRLEERIDVQQPSLALDEQGHGYVYVLKTTEGPVVLTVGDDRYESFFRSWARTTSAFMWLVFGYLFLLLRGDTVLDVTSRDLAYLLAALNKKDLVLFNKMQADSPKLVWASSVPAGAASVMTFEANYFKTYLLPS